MRRSLEDIPQVERNRILYRFRPVTWLNAASISLALFGYPVVAMALTDLGLGSTANSIIFRAACLAICIASFIFSRRRSAPLTQIFTLIVFIFLYTVR